MKTGHASLLGLSLALFGAACLSPATTGEPGTAGSGGPGSAGTTGGGNTTGTAGTTGGGNTTGTAGTYGEGGTTGGGNTTGTAGTTGGGNTTGTAGTTGGGNTTGTAGTGGGNTTGTAGTTGGGNTTGTAGTGGSAPPVTAKLITSSTAGYWKTTTWTEPTSGTATVTVNDATLNQKWDGFGGAFNEMGWNVLTTPAVQTQAMTMLFSPTDGANFAWGRIPMGASDYGMTRYTLADAGAGDPVATSAGTNRPAADTSLSSFSLARDGEKLIPYIKAAKQVRPDLKFWASPWTPPIWMKTGLKTESGGQGGGAAKRLSYFDGGNMSATHLAAYAQYFVKFVEGYKAQNINIEVVSPQNEPGYDQNYPSCLWDSATYVSFIGQHLGPAMKALNVRVMLGTMSNAGDAGRNDINIATAVLGNATAKSMVSVVGAQWGVLDKVNGGQTFQGLPVWATEHKCGNYPWGPTGYPAYNMTMAPNDQAYAVESWGYIRDAITKGKVTSYNAWNMVLDRLGLGNDTSRDWRQNALLVANGTSVTATPTYHVFRHASQYVVPGANVVATSGGDGFAFKNPDGSVVAVTYNSGGANANYMISIKGKRYQFAMPAQGWATLVIP